MADSKLYSALWKKQLPLIKLRLKMTGKEEQRIELSKSDFKVAGNRDKYAFSLLLDKGIVANNISGSAVARDLAEVLQNSIEVKSWLIEHNVTISLDSNFVLKMRQNI